MLNRLSKWSNRFYSHFSISKTTKMNLDKCYFRFIESEDKVDITFLLKVKDFPRQFNFSRKPTETLETLFVRIGTNVQKAINKAVKKKGKTENQDVPVNAFDNKNELISGKAICQDLFTIDGPVKLKILEHEFEIVFNSPWVVNISLPLSILSGFPVYPEHITTFYTDIQKSTFNWYKGNPINSKGANESHIKWELCGTGFTYTPKAQDIGCKLKLECVPANDSSLVGPAVETISKGLVEAGPGNCPFETRHLFTPTKLSGKSFRCVSYNILADLYCDSEHTRTVLHPYCPPYALHIDYRKQLIMKELIGYNADIICLQEVDRKIFFHCLQQFLGTEGFDGCFYKKGKEVAEGLACFYRRDRFALLDQHTIVLSQAVQTEKCLSTIWDAIKDNEPFKERLLDRSTVASATVLQSLDNDQEIVLVGNTHLYFHPDSDHIRLVQGGICIYWLADLKKKIMAQHPNKKVSLMICGDFNSDPGSGIYHLYTKGTAPKTLEDWQSNKSQAVTNLELQQSIPMDSACGTPQYTNFTAGFADCLDYIYYETTHLEVEQVIPLPSVEELSAHTALPSIVFPSDHVSIVSDLRFK